MKTKSVQLVRILSAGMCCGRKNCPGVWEIEGGDIAVIGKVVSSSALKGNGLGVAVARNERMVVIPRAVLKSARKHLSRL